jgi:hypothetical protein
MKLIPSGTLFNRRFCPAMLPKRLFRKLLI